MQNNDSVLINKIYLKGINNVFLYFDGKKFKNGNFELIIDGEKVYFRTNYKLDKEYVYNRILKQNQDKFSYVAKIPSSSKNIKLLYNNVEVANLKTNKLSRFINLLVAKVSGFFKKIVRLPKIIIKTIKLMWKRHHLLVPPRMIKQYLNSFSNNMSNKNIDELLYNPLVDNDYRKWLDEQEKEKIEKIIQH